ncbi:GNAT family N-acetyltransferase [Thermospira aquatica]|uniref:GNAT family N-acetyltransferase n=1 Tax=Thermospira aquatica TaxID=2828656 RepID=A0AAX3BEZ1_9SPIR|nr:GNAT family N-acetyltransferase [Thermospira aquatica]URA10703.1 GNAT family N-acetyltransferase [Thermospira aquatica]
MEIRLAKPDETNELIEMCRWFTTSPFQFDDRLEGVSSGFEPIFAKNMLLSPSTITYVATESQKILGFIAFHPLSPISEHAGKRIANILLLVVRPENQNQGIGGSLVDRALSHLSNLQVDIVTVGTDLYNIPALQVYTSRGFYPRLVWHIFRYYDLLPKDKKELPSQTTSLSANIRPLSLNEIQPFEESFSRPLSLLRDKYVHKSSLRKYLIEKWKSQINQAKLFCLGYCINDRPIALITIQQDTLSEQTLKTEKPVYRILDVLTLPSTELSILRSLLQEMTVRFSASLLEIWIDATENLLIQTIEDAGFRLAYSGINLHAYPVPPTKEP